MRGSGVETARVWCEPGAGIWWWWDAGGQTLWWWLDVVGQKRDMGQNLDIGQNASQVTTFAEKMTILL